jgi:transcriptional regulator with XRE-family HTH domain
LPQAVGRGKVAQVPTNPEIPILAARLHERRTQIGLRQEDLAAELSKVLGDGRERDPSAISRWEIGRTKPDIDELRGLAEVLGCTSDYLIGISHRARELPAGYFLVDLDAHDALRAGKPLPHRHSWYAVIPDRHRVCSSSEFDLLNKALDPYQRRK